MTEVLAAFGLSAASGLNAYLPLLVVGLLARFSDLITLKAPWNVLENPWVLGVLGVLLLIEMTVDKIPAVDTVNDVIQTLVRPVAGALLFASSSNVISDVNPVLAAVCGLLAAGGVHAVKATARPALTATTLGTANPIISAVEDVVSLVATLVSLLLPALAAVVIVGILLFVLYWRFGRRKRRSAL